jgi:hypothetical protein
VRKPFRYQTTSLAVAAVAGAGLGVFAQVGDGINQVGDVTSRGGLWLVVIVVVGVTAPTTRAAAGRGVALFLASLAGYYVMGTLDSGWSPPWATVQFWAVAAVTLVPLLAAAAQWAWTSSHPWSPAVLGLLSGAALAEAFVIAGESSRHRYLSLAFDLVAGVVLAISAVARTSRPRRVALGIGAGIVAGIVAVEGLTAAYRAWI